MSTPLQIDAGTVRASLPPPLLIEALRGAFATGAEVPGRARHEFGAGSLLVMPAWRDGGHLGVKLVTVVPGNAARGLPAVHAVYTLLSQVTGQVEAIIDGDALTAARTAAVSALAADLLAPAGAETLLLVGTGQLVPHLVRAHGAVRPYRRVAIWGRDAGKAAALAALLRDEGITAVPAGELEAAVRDADVVSCATLSCAPLVHGAWLRDGAHLDLVGGFKPEMREADSDAVAAGGVVVDTLTALQECGDLLAPVAEGRLRPDWVVDLGALLRGAPVHRRRITVFKSVGTALADLAAAEALLANLQQ